MRTPGLSLGYMQILSAGPVENPSYLGGSIGPSFFTPEQQAFRNMRKLYGGDDPDAGGYNLAQIDWNKESGTVEVGHTDPSVAGWLDA